VVGGCRFTPTTAEADLAGPINYANRVVGGWGHSHKIRMREQFGHVLSIGGIGESLPDPGSFIDLDPEQKDVFGLPKARIHSHLAETELKRLDFMAKTCRRILLAAGVEKPFEEYGAYDNFNATHVFGTCRMGDDPKSSVVDPFCRSHRWRNLLVVDASVFPSSGGGESPSLTIYALALRAAGHFASLHSALTATNAKY
jgi:choline dehydrogenase-like flavoprotein